MTSAENSVSEPPNFKIFGGRIPPDPHTWLVPSALTRVPPCTKKPTYGPAVLKLDKFHLRCPVDWSAEKSVTINY